VCYRSNSFGACDLSLKLCSVFASSWFAFSLLIARALASCFWILREAVTLTLNTTRYYQFLCQHTASRQIWVSDSMSQNLLREMQDFEVVVKVDYTNEQQSADLCSLLNGYAMDPKGGGAPLNPSTLAALPSQLHSFGNATSFILYVKSSDDGALQPAALANCILGFSTFNAKPLLNIHDFYVDRNFRGMGFSQKLLQHGTCAKNMLSTFLTQLLLLSKSHFTTVEDYAREIGCCKLTLEVQDKNEAAMSAYRKFGFEGYALDPVDGKAMFWQKKFN
jgi:GNAT superfamily N-acetyltransferase